MNEKIGILSQEIETIGKNQIENIELKNKISEIRTERKNIYDEKKEQSLRDM